MSGEIRDVAPRVGRVTLPSHAQMDEFIDTVIGTGSADISEGKWRREELRTFAYQVLEEFTPLSLTAVRKEPAP